MPRTLYTNFYNYRYTFIHIRKYVMLRYSCPEDEHVNTLAVCLLVHRPVLATEMFCQVLSYDISRANATYIFTRMLKLINIVHSKHIR